MNEQPKQPIKVVRIIARLNVGGPALHCMTLSQKLASRGFDTTLISGSPDKNEADFQELFDVKPSGFRLIKLPEMTRSISILSDLKTFIQMIRLVRQEKPTIVHTHTAKAGLLGRLAAFMCGVPIVIHTFHGHVLSGYFSPFKSKLIKWLERILALKTTRIVTLSNSLRDELSDRFKIAPHNRFSIVPLGRDLEKFLNSESLRGELRKELGISNDTFLIGTVGRLVPIKNQAALIEACSKLSESIKWALVIAGEGELSDTLKNLAKSLNVSKQVHFIGWRTDLPRLYADFDVFVLTSKNEGTPLSIIEAFASGCPVISTNVGGVSDLFSKENNEGFLVVDGDDNQLRFRLESLALDHPLRARMSVAARERGRSFSDEKLSERMAHLYNELLGEIA